MAMTQTVAHPNLTLCFSPARYMRDKKSELLLPIKWTIPSSFSFPSSVLINHGVGSKSRKPNRFCCTRADSDELVLMSTKHEASKGTLFSRSRRSGLPDATIAGGNTENTSIAPCKGVGIVDFLRRKNFLITGATGFLGKVLIEKILRMQPDIGKLFLIIRADHESTSASKRLINEVMNSELFKGLREIHGNEFHEFMLKRLVPVAGDMTKHNLGIEKDMVDVLTREVDIIVSSAANTTFDERYDVALDTNTKAIIRLLEFGKCCKKTQLLMHISTAYVNGLRQGRVLEEPFQMGYSIANEKSICVPPLDIQAEFHLARKALEDFEIEFSNLQNYKLKKGKVAQRMKDLGMERARSYGWQDTYVFSKAMAEMVICDGREDLPVVIVRPTVIESTYSQPFPGWIEGHRMMDPVITRYGKGQLPCFLADPDTVFDLIPVDMVVNAILAAMAKHAEMSGVTVYHVASSVANPIRIGEIFKIMFQHFKRNPYIDHKGNPVRLPKQVTCVNTVDNYRQGLERVFHSPNNKPGLSSSAKSILLQLEHMAKIYEPYTFYKARFDISNLENLFQELSAEEQASFGFDVKYIQWENYIANIHIPGLRQYVLKGRGAAERPVSRL